ncbi:MAG: restriction endonuclease subunit S [Gemmatales bacterium]|nr:MAG: restriction endonuclease subunit S [Gemmatales bacterium]
MVPEGWKRIPVSAIARVVRGSSPRPARDPRFFNGDYIPWITVRDVTCNSEMYLRSTASFLTEEGAKRTRIIEPGTLLLTNSGATLGVPKITLIRAGANDGIAALLDLRDVLREFLYYFFTSKTEYLRESVAPGNGQPNLNTDLIGDLIVALPPLTEQRRIVEVLSTWDRAIEQTEKLIAAKRRLKQGLMQQLLTGRRRFREFVRSTDQKRTHYFSVPADWEVVHVEDVASEVTERNGIGNNIPVLSCTKHDGLVESLKYFGRRVFSEDLSNYKIVRRGQFAYATNHIEEGSIGLLRDLEAGLISPMYTVFETDSSIHAPYLYLLFKTELFRYIFEANTNGSVNRRGSLRWNQFKKIVIPVPQKSEQFRIAGVFDEIDKHVTELSQLADHLRAQKRGLMQKLLTGQVRVKVEERTGVS